MEWADFSARDCAKMKPNLSRIPKLTTMRDSNPITGEVWVVDENKHQVASFRVKLPQCHLMGAIDSTMDASRNLLLAEALIEHLYSVWDIERCAQDKDAGKPKKN